jgi:hypothetical protein
MKGVLLMIRGACQPFRFRTPYPLSRLSAVRITFGQRDNEALPIIKTKKDCTTDDSLRYIYVTLNQEETLAFHTDCKAFVQFEGLTDEGFAFKNLIKPITVYPTMNTTILNPEEEEG